MDGNPRLRDKRLRGIFFRRTGQSVPPFPENFSSIPWTTDAEIDMTSEPKSAAVNELTVNPTIT